MNQKKEQLSKRNKNQSNLNNPKWQKTSNKQINSPKKSNSKN